MAVSDAFPADSEDPNLKNALGKHIMPPDTPKRFDQDLPLPLSLGCYSTPAHTFAPLFP